MPNLADALTRVTGLPDKGGETPATVLLPPQPPGVPAGKLFLGDGLGYAPHTGERPAAGDLVVVLAGENRRVALAGTSAPPLREPVFPFSECKCKCPGTNGGIFYLSFAENTPVIQAFDADTGTLQQLFGQQDLGYGAGAIVVGSLAVDPEPPHNVYVLDDPRAYFTVLTDLTPTVRRAYFGIATYAVSAGAYVFSSFAELTDPYTPGPHDPLNPSIEPDPPAIPGNCLSVLGGLPVVTMLNAPARYLSLDGGIYTTHTLTLNGSPYASHLRANIVTVKDKPANRNLAYVLATDDTGSAFELLEFDPGSDVISRRVALNLPAKAKQLASVCNRIMILATDLDSWSSFTEE